MVKAIWVPVEMDREETPVWEALVDKWAMAKAIWGKMDKIWGDYLLEPLQVKGWTKDHYQKVSSHKVV